MKKECGMTYDELMSEVGFVNSLDNGEQASLAKIISDNNEAIKEYIDSKLSPGNIAKQTSSGIMDGLRKKGMRQQIIT
jgi:hypothetical protein